METLSTKVKSKRDEYFAMLKNIVDEPCTHTICPECEAKKIENARLRNELGSKVNEYDELLKVEIIIK